MWDGDFSVAIVILVTDDPMFEVLMTIRTQHDNTNQFTRKLVRYLKKYFCKYNSEKKIVSGPTLIVEKNGVGNSVLILLREDEYCYYPWLYWDIKTTTEKMDRSFKPGFVTTPVTRLNILQRLFNIIHDRQIILNDQTITTELQTLVRNPDTGRVQADSGKHDDCIFALALAIQSWSVDRPNKQSDVVVIR